MNAKKIIILVIAALLAVVITGLSLGAFNHSGESGNKTWKTYRVTRRDMGSSVLATGIIKPCVGAEVRVGSRVSGIVKRLHVKIGDYVEQGQLLGELDRTEFAARYHSAEAALENARIQLDYAALNLKRQKALKKKNFTSQDKVDVAESAYDVAESLYKQRKADLDYAAIQLSYTRIQAPISGVVASVSTQEGETVAASFTAPTFVVIIDLSRLEVRAYVDETDIGRIKEKQSATFTVDTYPGIDFEGSVTAIYPGAEMKDNVVNYIAVIDITGFKGRTLRPEMTTTVNIFQESRKMVPTIPKGVINREAGKKWVYVAKGTNREKRFIDTGYSDDQYIEILNGLEDDERVVVSMENGYN